MHPLERARTLLERLDAETPDRVAESEARAARVGLAEQWRTPEPRRPERNTPEVETASTANTEAWARWVCDLVDKRIEHNNSLVAEVLSREYVPRHIAKTAIDAMRSDISELRAKVTLLESLLKGSVINLVKPDKNNAA